MISGADVKTKLEKFWESKEKKSSIQHLIRAFIPWSNCRKVQMFTVKENHQCVLCRADLICSYDLEHRLTMLEKPNALLMKVVKETINGKEMAGNETIKKVAGGKRMAVDGDKTHSMCCPDCIQALEDFVAERLGMGDGQMVWLVKSAGIKVQKKKDPKREAEEEEARKEAAIKESMVYTTATSKAESPFAALKNLIK